MIDTKKVTHISEARSFEPHKMSPERKRRLKRTGVAAGLLALGSVAAVVTGEAVVDHLNAPSFSQNVESQIEAKPKLLNGQLVLYPGVSLRSEPNMQNADQYDPSTSVVSKVEPGRAIVVDSPLVYTDQIADTYYGFKNNEGDYRWANFTQLIEEQKTSDATLAGIHLGDGITHKEARGYFSDGQFYEDSAHTDPAAIAQTVELSKLPDYIS